MADKTYTGHIFQVKAHQKYASDFTPKTAREISYLKQSKWARCEGKNNVLYYLSSHVDKEEKIEAFNNKEKLKNFSGFFDKNNLLTKKEKNALKEKLQKTDATIYTAVFSFSNVSKVKVSDSTMAREIIQKTFDNFLKKADLDPNNVEWFGCIHTNTDHIHSHIVFFEKDKQYLDSKGNLNYKTTLHPVLPKDALDFYRFKVSDYMINNNLKYDLRDKLLSMFKDNVEELSVREIIHKYSLQMDDFKVKQYGRLTDKNKKVVDDCIDEIIRTDPTLKAKNDEYENQLQTVQDEYEAIIDENNLPKFRKRIEKYKETRVEDLHKRFGNQVLDLMHQDKEISVKKSEYKTIKSKDKTYYANSPELIREKAIYMRNIDYEQERDAKKLIEIMSDTGAWTFKYKDIADMVQSD